MIGYHIKEALRGFAVLAFLGAVIFLALRCQGCRPAEDPSIHHQAIVQSLAYGVKAADLACASVARAKMDEKLAADCAFAYDAARVSLSAADDKLDAPGDQDVSCEVAQALAYARQMAAVIEKHGGKLPKALDRALPLASLFAETCHG